MKRQQQGFTLIELVIVIVILGILSAFALPRFADLGGDARASAINGAAGSMKSASSIVRSCLWVDSSCSRSDDKKQVQILSVSMDSRSIYSSVMQPRLLPASRRLRRFRIRISKLVKNLLRLHSPVQRNQTVKRRTPRP